MTVVMCEYVPAVDGCRCAVCGDWRKHCKYSRICSGHEERAKAPLTVGRALKKILARDYGVAPCGSCHETAARMDALGPDGCRKQLPELGEELQSNANRMNWKDLLLVATPKTVAGAIRAKVQGPAFFESLVMQAVVMVESDASKPNTKTE